MAARHRSRQRALQVLYQWDVTKQPVKNAIDSFYDTLYSEESSEEIADRPGRDEFMEELATGTCAIAEDLDRRIQQSSQNWRLERMPMVDRNILRLALYEMIKSGTPRAVVIDEALELARQFSGDESVGFINGVLDAVNTESAP